MDTLDSFVQGPRQFPQEVTGGSGNTSTVPDTLRDRFMRVRSLELIAKDDEVIVDLTKKTAQRSATTFVSPLTNQEVSDVVIKKACEAVVKKTYDVAAKTAAELELDAMFIKKAVANATGYHEKDMVNQPPHYKAHKSGVECIQITEHMNFCLGNAVKYIWRAEEKGSTIEDLKKARWYLDREIKRREGVK